MGVDGRRARRRRIGGRLTLPPVEPYLSIRGVGAMVGQLGTEPAMDGGDEAQFLGCEGELGSIGQRLVSDLDLVRVRRQFPDARHLRSVK